MDWSSVFEDEGEENGDWTRGYDPSPRTGILELLSMQGKYGPMICYAFTVNYILGVGCLGIPYAFLQSGIMLGILLVIFLSFISYVTVLWVAAATQQEMSISLYRATTNPFIISPLTTLAKRKHLLNKKIKKDKNSSKNLAGDEETAFDESSSLLTGSTSFRNLYSSFSTSFRQLVSSNGIATTESSSRPYSTQNSSQTLEKSDQLLMIAIEKESNNSSAPSSSRRKPSNKGNTTNFNQDEIAHSIKELEVTDLVEEFLGPWGKVTYQVSLMALTYVGLLAYTQVFNGTFRSQLFPAAPTYLPPLLFGIIVIPLSCFDLSEQVVAQVIMSLLRFISLGILLIGTIIALWTDWKHSLLYESLSIHTSSEGGTSFGSSNSAIYYMNLQGFGVMFTTAIFSQLFQHSVPGLIRPLKEEHKKYIPKIFSAALLTTSIIYILSGTCCVFYFGRHLQQSVNLNFVNFTWGIEADTSSSSSSSVLAMITGLAMTVVLFPALDTLSVFPLIAITLGNNLHAAFPQFDEQILWMLTPIMTLISRGLSSSSSMNTTSATIPTAVKKEQKKWINLFWRLTAAIPPVILSVIITNLVVSLQIAGLCGIVVALVTPALLHQQTQYRIELIPASMKVTIPFPDSFNNTLYVNLVLGIAFVAAAISFCQMIW